MSNEPTVKAGMKLIAFVSLFSLMIVATPWLFSPRAQQEAESIPKPPENDFTVQVYKALDAKKAERLSFKDKYRPELSIKEIDVEVIVTYYNWSVNEEDYWNRQLNIETKNEFGDVVEKIVKTGFGDLGYVKKGDAKTQDTFNSEKITSSGGALRSVMADVPIGEKQKQRYRSVLEKFILGK
jgi:heme/copper-type cytochrome/quinol oxidase subunit 2